MKINHEPHDYQPVLNALRILRTPTLEDRKKNAASGAKILNGIVSSSINASVLLCRVGLRIPFVGTTAQKSYQISTVKVNYLEVGPLRNKINK